MPRRGRSLRTIRTVKPKFKWSPVYSNQTTTLPQTAANNTAIRPLTICANTATADNIVPPVLKVRHLKVRITIPPVAADSILQSFNILFYLVYCPQSIEPTAQTPSLHPEWILASTSSGAKQHDSTLISLSSPISKNLNSGDTIKLLIINVNSTAANFAANVPIGYNYSYVARTN